MQRREKNALDYLKGLFWPFWLSEKVKTQLEWHWYLVGLPQPDVKRWFPECFDGLLGQHVLQIKKQPALARVPCHQFPSTRGLAGFPKQKATRLSLCLPSSGLLIGLGPRRVGLGGDGRGWRCYEWACR